MSTVICCSRFARKSSTNISRVVYLLVKSKHHLFENDCNLSFITLINVSARRYVLPLPKPYCLSLMFGQQADVSIPRRRLNAREQLVRTSGRSTDRKQKGDDTSFTFIWLVTIFQTGNLVWWHFQNLLRELVLFWNFMVHIQFIVDSQIIWKQFVRRASTQNEIRQNPPLNLGLFSSCSRICSFHLFRSTVASVLTALHTLDVDKRHHFLIYFWCILK